MNSKRIHNYEQSQLLEFTQISIFSDLAKKNVKKNLVARPIHPELNAMRPDQKNRSQIFIFGRNVFPYSVLDAQVVMNRLFYS